MSTERTITVKAADGWEAFACSVYGGFVFLKRPQESGAPGA